MNGQDETGEETGGADDDTTMSPTGLFDPVMWASSATQPLAIIATDTNVSVSTTSVLR